MVRFSILAGSAAFAAALAICSCGQRSAPQKPPQVSEQPAPAIPKTPAPSPLPLPPPVPAPIPAAPLANPPDIIRAVYFTSWSAGIRSRIDYLISLKKTTGVNAVVFDVKDYSGYIDYRTAAAEPNRYGAVRVTIRDIDALIARLHEAGIYVIGRITVFQDPILAQARPELAVHRRSRITEGAELTRESLWLDRKGLAWIDPASQPAWHYTVAIVKDLLSRGIDEVNFDYVRFPTDGNMKDMHYPAWDGKTPKHEVIANFFAYLRKELPGVPLSADLFGLATVNQDDLGIGQVIEDAYTSFDYVCPMVYPSHFARKFLGFPNPAEHPAEVVGYSMRSALKKLTASSHKAKIRPWLQDFNVGARYDAGRVKAQIDATEEALGEQFAGYMLWAPSNVYTADALKLQ